MVKSRGGAACWLVLSIVFITHPSLQGLHTYLYSRLASSPSSVRWGVQVLKNSLSAKQLAGDPETSESRTPRSQRCCISQKLVCPSESKVQFEVSISDFKRAEHSESLDTKSPSYIYALRWKWYANRLLDRWQVIY